MRERQASLGYGSRFSFFLFFCFLCLLAGLCTFTERYPEGGSRGRLLEEGFLVCMVGFEEIMDTGLSCPSCVVVCDGLCVCVALTSGRGLEMGGGDCVVELEKAEASAIMALNPLALKQTKRTHSSLRV